MTEIIKYVLAIIAAIVIFRLATALLGGLFGSFTGLAILVLIGWLIWRTLTNRGRPA